MKKAKEYYKEILEAEKTKDKSKIDLKVKEVFKNFVLEIKELRDMRNVSTDQGLMAIIKEQNNKWNALCNKCIYLKRDAIKDYSSGLISGAKV